MNIDMIKEKLSDFSKAREWDKFHSPKNISMAMSVEVAELVEIFQWLSEDESRNLDSEQIRCVKEEIADISIYILTMCMKLDIDLGQAILSKIELNEQKHPAIGNKKSELSKCSSML